MNDVKLLFSKNYKANNDNVDNVKIKSFGQMEATGFLEVNDKTSSNETASTF